MSATAAHAIRPQSRPVRQAGAAPAARSVGLALTERVAGQEQLLPAPLLGLLVSLHRMIEPGRRARLAARRERQAFFDAGGLPNFRADTAAIRAGDWKVAPIPRALRDRRVEITGPTDPKMVINALNSGANCYMADFEDSTAPTWRNLLAGQRALAAAVDGTLAYTAPDTGKQYRLRPYDERAVLIVRPRGWHLDEKHVRVDGEPMAGGLFDMAVFAWHNARTLMANDRGPYFYLPKLQSMEEAELWEQALSHTEAMLGLPQGQMKVTVLIETLPAVFEMDEILYALKDRVVGLNCGRWDYIFSYLKTFRAHADKVLPERGQVTMTQPFLKAYSELLIRTCHRRGAHAMGGMAAQIPAQDPEANEQALARVRQDKLREVMAGHDGTWVAHPALIPVARQVFDAYMPTANQHHVRRDDVQVTRDDLIAPCQGSITREGFENNIEVCVRYLAAWLDGNGCVPIHGMMEDAATAEISRAQLWQWLHLSDPRGRHADGRPVHLDDGTPIDFALFEQALERLPQRLGDVSGLPGGARIAEATALLDQLTRAGQLVEFLTLPAYARLD